MYLFPSEGNGGDPGQHISQESQSQGLGLKELERVQVMRLSAASCYGEETVHSERGVLTSNQETGIQVPILQGQKKTKIRDEDHGQELGRWKWTGNRVETKHRQGPR